MDVTRESDAKDRCEVTCHSLWTSVVDQEGVPEGFIMPDQTVHQFHMAIPEEYDELLHYHSVQTFGSLNFRET